VRYTTWLKYLIHIQIFLLMCPRSLVACTKLGLVLLFASLVCIIWFALIFKLFCFLALNIFPLLKAANHNSNNDDDNNKMIIIWISDKEKADDKFMEKSHGEFVIPFHPAPFFSNNFSLSLSLSLSSSLPRFLPIPSSFIPSFSSPAASHTIPFTHHQKKTIWVIRYFQRPDLKLSITLLPF
jgi:hypothetical protein